MPSKSKRKQQSAKPSANQKGEKSWKEAEKEVVKESAMVVPKAPKQLGNVATVQPEEEVAKESAVPDEAEKVGAKVCLRSPRRCQRNQQFLTRQRKS
jgi:hypothetical protein